MMKHLIEFTEYHTPDGLIYPIDTETDRFLISESGLGMPGINYITQKGPFQHGETVIDYRLEPRTIQMVHRRNSCSRDEYWDARADLINHLRPNRSTSGTYSLGKLRKKLPGGKIRDINVRLDQGPVFVERDLEKWDEWGISETLRFIAPDPTFYDPTQNVLTYVISLTDHLIFPFTFIPYPGTDLVFMPAMLGGASSITYLGTWLTYPTIVITGPLYGPIITNLTTGEKIQIGYNVQAGDVLTITLEYGNKTVTNLAGMNLIGSVSTDSDLATFHIAPDPEAAGGVNSISVVGAQAAMGVTSPDPLALE